MPKISEITNQMNPAAWLEQELDKYDQTTVRPPKKRDYFSPSSAHWCPRAIWYYMMGYTQDPIPANNLRRMMVGTVYHEWLEEKLKGTGVLVSSEEEVTWDDPPIVGHYDGIIERPSDGKHLLLEIKSMANPKSKYALKYLPRTEHLIQWNLYSMMTDLEEGLIFYINKNTQDYLIYPVERDQALLDTTLHKLRKIKKYIDEGDKVPYRPKENHDWCNFQQLCEREHFVEGI